MTNKQRVFCKGCRWMEEGYRELNDGTKILISQQCKPEPFYDPITGETLADNSYYEPRIHNAHCDCSDYEAKGVGMDNKQPDPWGLRDILNGTDTPKWWEVWEKFRRWWRDVKARRAKEQRIRRVMKALNCDYNEAVEFISEIYTSYETHMKIVTDEINHRLIGDAKERAE